MTNSDTSECIDTVPLTDKNVVLQNLKSRRLVGVHIPLSAQDKKDLQDLKINVEGVQGNFLFWGNINKEAFSNDALLPYLNSLGDNATSTLETLAATYTTLAKQVTALFDTEHAWVEIKTFFPNDTFLIPRWHTDNKFFVPHTAYKLVWAAKGAQTLFGYTNNADEFSRLTALEIAAGHGTRGNIEARKELNSIVTELLTREEGQAVLYQSGGPTPVVHSEPPINESRIFIAIVPGTEDEIRLWHDRKMQKDQRKGVLSRKWSFNTLS